MTRIAITAQAFERLRHFVSTSWGKVIVAIGGFGVLIGLIGNVRSGVDDLWTVWSWAFPVPSVQITASVPGSDFDALAVNFRFENTGSIGLVDIEISCDIRAANAHFVTSSNTVLTPGRASSQWVPRLDPGKPPIVRNCGELISGFLGTQAEFPATFTITVKSRWPTDHPDKTFSQTEQFLGVKDAGGHVVIERGT
jgi:hypothetical protein